MTDLINRLTDAIIRQEGSTDNNAGNLRDCPWFPMVSGKPDNQGKTISYRVYPDGSKVQTETKGSSGQFWAPRTKAEGVAGLAHVIALRIAMGQSLRQLISAYAPPSDKNNTEAYIAHLKEWARIPDSEVPLWNYLL